MTPPLAPLITVIGCDGRPQPDAARTALAQAARVAGAPRQLAGAGLQQTKETIPIKRLDEALDAITAGPGPVAVLASGDPGFFGIVRAIRERGIEPVVIPASSSVAMAFGRIGLDWDDALVLSAHGRQPRQVLAAALAHQKVAILTGQGEAAAGALAAELISAGRTVYVAERLGTGDERIVQLRPGEPACGGQDAVGPFTEPNVLIAVDQRAPSHPRWMAGHTGAPDGWALREDAFEHRDSMITKSEVRALALARLGPGPGRIIWDIGSGSGSVAVECARFGAWVIAVERDGRQCERIRRNAAAHRVYLRVRHASAPDALDGLPSPDAIFAGGGDDDVLAAALRLGQPSRVVVTAASIDRVRSVRDLLAGLGYAPDGVQLQASRLAAFPSGSLRLAAANPVFVLWGTLPESVVGAADSGKDRGAPA